MADEYAIYITVSIQKVMTIDEVQREKEKDETHQEVIKAITTGDWSNQFLVLTTLYGFKPKSHLIGQLGQPMTTG